MAPRKGLPPDEAAAAADLPPLRLPWLPSPPLESFSLSREAALLAALWASENASTLVVGMVASVESVVRLARVVREAAQ